jgi:hypothetical protein
VTGPPVRINNEAHNLYSVLTWLSLFTVLASPSTLTTIRQPLRTHDRNLSQRMFKGFV